MDAARAGVPMHAVGAAIEGTVLARGHSVCAALHGHGIGRRIHEPPDVAPYFDPSDDEPLTAGLVMTIEPIVSTGSGEVVEGDDGWTVRTADGALSAHAEHTIVVRDGAPPLVLTA
jgi:methionyl aminopeptidase